MSDLVRAQRLADGFAGVDWVRVLGRYARQINPLLSGLLAPMRYYRVTSQSEYSTDVLFRTRRDLEELFPRLLQYSTLYFEIWAFRSGSTDRWRASPDLAHT